MPKQSFSAAANSVVAMEDLLIPSTSATTLLSALRDHATSHMNKKLSHRRTVSLDSGDTTSSRESNNSSSKVRRKMVRSIAELLQSKSLTTIDSAASLGSEEETCATEETVNSPSADPTNRIRVNITNTNNNSSKMTAFPEYSRYRQQETEKPLRESFGTEMTKVHRRTTSKRDEAVSPKPNKRKSRINHQLTKENKRKQDTKPNKNALQHLKPPRKLVPRVSRSILQRRSEEPLVLPSKQTTATPTTVHQASTSRRPPMAPSPAASQQRYQPSAPPLLSVRPPPQIRRQSRQRSYPPLEGSPATPNHFLRALQENSGGDSASISPLSPMRLSFEYQFESPKVVLTQDHFAHAPMNINELDLATIFDEDVMPSLSGAVTPSEDLSVVICTSHFDNRHVPVSPLTPHSKASTTNKKISYIDPVPFSLEPMVSESNGCVGMNESYIMEAAVVTPESSDSQPPPPQPPQVGAFKENRMVEYKSAEQSASMRSMRTITKSVPVDVDDLRFVDAERNLATIEEMANEHFKQGEFGEALDVYKEVLRGYLKKHGYEHAVVGTILHTMASTHMKQKHYTKAVQVSHKAIYVRRMALGREHPDVAASLVLRGLALFEKKKYTEALESFEEALHIRRNQLGGGHLLVAKVLNNIGCTWKQLGNNGEAIMAFEESIRLQKNALTSYLSGDEASQLSLSIASSLSNVCTVKLSLGLVHEALSALREAFQVFTF